MKMKRFFAENMRLALAEVKKTLGPDAVIMSSKNVAGGVEIVAAYDPDTAPVAQVQQAPAQASHLPPGVVPAEAIRGGQQKQEAIADSLEALLGRQQEEHQGKMELNKSHAAMNPGYVETEYQQKESPLYRPDPLEAQASGNRHLQEPVAYVGQQTIPESHILSDDQVALRLAQQDTEMRSMRDDMSMIRELLENQVSGLMAQDFERREPMRAMMMKRLSKLGIESDVASQLVQFIAQQTNQEQAWQQTMELMQRQIQTTDNDILRRGGVVALVGPTGVGKTTTVAKLAARFAKHFGPENVAMVTTDTYRIAAAEQLQTYGRIIGCTVKVARDADELNMVLGQLSDRKLILIDTAGMSQRDMHLTQQLADLMRSTQQRIRTYLVLAATAQPLVQHEICRRFQNLRPEACIFTKVDECLSLGESLSVSIQNRLPISYITDGQRVPEDIKVAQSSHLVTLADKMAQAFQQGHGFQHEQANHANIMYM